MRVRVGIIDLSLIRCGRGSCHEAIFMGAKEYGELKGEWRMERRVEDLHVILNDIMGGHAARMLRVRARRTRHLAKILLEVVNRRCYSSRPAGL